MDLTDKKIITSPYRRGADFGFLFGIYLTVMFFGSIFAGSLPLGGILSFVLMLGVPVFIFIALWRYDRELQGCATFPMMWMAGVVTFICGILISGALLVIYMKWIEPDFVVAQLEGLVETGKQLPGTPVADAGEIASQMIKANFIPSPIAIVTELIMAAIVSGSILSIIISAGFAMRHKALRRRNQQ